MYLRAKKSGAHTYLQLVESIRDGGKVRQYVRLSFGRLDELLASGQLDTLTSAFAKFSQRLSVLGAHQAGQLDTDQGRVIGPALVFDRLWERTRIRQVIESRLRTREFEFPVERAIFLTVLHRLLDPGSDRAAEKWAQTQAIRGTGALGLHHLYRSMRWLGEELGEVDARGEEHFSIRSVKDLLEEDLFLARREQVFPGLSLVFFDTTSIYFEGQGGTLGRHGHSKDHRPDLHQVVVGVVMDDKGHPVCSEMWPGNTADVTALVPVARRLKERFGVESVCIVADRGMVSDKNIQALKDLGWRYIIGARMRSDGEVRDEVLGRAGRYSEVVGADDEDGRSPLKVKEVMVEGERYVVCVNEDQAKKDRFDREAIVAALEDQLKKGAKTLVGNRGYRKFLAVEGGRFSIDREKLKEEARFDGKWVLRTNMDLPSDEIALRYKQLNDVESAFRAMKSTLDTRPVFHQLTETIRGHVFCSFLALVLRKELLDLLTEQGKEQEWNDLVRDLSALMEMNATAADGKQFLIRNEARPAAKAAFAVCGIALPPVVRSAPMT